MHLSGNPGRKHILGWHSVTESNALLSEQGQPASLGEIHNLKVSADRCRPVGPSVLVGCWNFPPTAQTLAHAFSTIHSNGHLVSNLAVDNEISPRITIKWNK